MQGWKTLFQILSSLQFTPQWPQPPLLPLSFPVFFSRKALTLHCLIFPSNYRDQLLLLILLLGVLSSKCVSKQIQEEFWSISFSSSLFQMNSKEDGRNVCQMSSLLGGITSDFYSRLLFFLQWTYIAFLLRNTNVQHGLKCEPQVMLNQGFKHNRACFRKLMDNIKSPNYQRAMIFVRQM